MRLSGPLRRFGRDTRGAAAAELALWLLAMIVPVYAAVDLGHYIFKRMQVEAAAQAAVAAAWKLCDQSGAGKGVPAVTNCTSTSPTLLSAMTTAAQATSLGTGVTLASAQVTEGYYCSTGNSLTLVGSTKTIGQTLPAQTANCTGSTDKPGDYLKATASYSFTPLYPVLSIAALLPTPITKDAWMRMD
jgi:Flp pilus assembly protein TadG